MKPDVLTPGGRSYVFLECSPENYGQDSTEETNFW